MKKTIKGLLFAALAAVTIVGFQQGALKADSANPGNDHKLEGAWEAVIWLPYGQQPLGSFIPTPFRILRTIAPVGVTDGYGFPALSFTPGSINSTGHGDWRKIGNGLYSVTVRYYELNYPNPVIINGFPSVANVVGTVQENIRLSADGNSYESDFLTTFTDANGGPLGSNGGKTKATRITVQPLP